MADGNPSFFYAIGSLFPRLKNKQPNLAISDSLRYDTKTQAVVARKAGIAADSSLTTSLSISTDPIHVPGIDRFLNNFLIPGLSDKDSPSSLFNAYLAGLTGGWTARNRNTSIFDARVIGYQGPGANQANNSNSFWNSKGQASDTLLQELADPANYNLNKYWKNYTNSTQISSDFDKAALKANLRALSTNKQSPPLWRPSYLYTYGFADQRGNPKATSYPGPTLMLQPGETLRAQFHNTIGVPGLSKRQNQLSTYIPNQSPGDNGGGGLGGTTNVNTHLHGAHVNPAGFGDNAVARYSTGQSWTNIMEMADDAGRGSYWYHPHYHPSVNQQLYGGLSGFTQVGDPLSLLPGLEKTPRNMALIKTLNLGVRPRSGKLKLTSFDSFLGQGSAPSQSFPVANNITVNTVNGSFQPTGKSQQGGWQSFSFTNQTNVTQHNLALIHREADGSERLLPLFMYGEDGHQLPQLRRVVGALATEKTANGSQPVSGYTQLPDVVSLPPGKRVDVLAYLPQGTTNIGSVYGNSSTTSEGITRTSTLASPKGGAANLTQQAKDLGSSAGPLARIKVKKPVASLNLEQQEQVIQTLNGSIETQEILPTTPESAYNPEAIPSVNLFATDGEGKAVWSPLRRRSFSFSNFALVGPEEEWDGPTQQALADYTATTGNTYQRYRTLPTGQPGMDTWLGYETPFLINDHVFPNGNLTIAQLGTMEEWQLRNWSQASPSYYIPHPFHIHINDYQTLDSDTELSDKRNLEDTTVLNSSGYNYYNTATGEIQERSPLKGNFHSIAEALDPSLGYNPNGSNQLATWGAVDQTVRMLFQDYLGTYVFHCHILAHEDSGMMQAVMVVENTDSSWLAPQQNFAVITDSQGAQRFDVRLAQTYEPFAVALKLKDNITLTRLAVGDLTDDYTQDLLVSSAGDGRVRLIDGQTLRDQQQTTVLASLKPYQTSLAPWAFAEDFTGDGQRDLITGGFTAAKSNGRVDLQDFEIKAWLPGNSDQSWDNTFSFKPYRVLDHHRKHHNTQAAKGLNSDQFSFIVGDFNLDNFNDFAMAYALEGGGFRVTILDGAAFSLLYQTGKLEGGYNPNRAVLADAVVMDSSLSDLSSLVLSAGFNSYAQGAIENLLVSTTSQAGEQLFTLNVNSGHFITTDLPEGSAGGHGGHGSHGSHGSSHESHQGLMNLDPDLTPLNLSAVNQLDGRSGPATATFSGAFATGAILQGDRLLLAQGNSANGIASTSTQLSNTAQQLVIDLAATQTVDNDELTGVVGSSLNTTYTANEVQARTNLSMVVMAAYGGLVGQPGDTARWAGGILGQGSTAAELVDAVLADPGWQARSTAHFGGSLSSLSVDTITGITAQTLFARSASSAELAYWNQQVAAGLNRTLVPLAMAQQTARPDRYRLAYLSTSGQWLAGQAGSQAMVNGSFSQGFQNDLARFTPIHSLPFTAGALGSWAEANAALDGLKANALRDLLGTPVSKSGFF